MHPISDRSPGARSLVVANARRTIRILFIGNSYTSRNDLPSLIRQLAAEGSTPWTVESEAVTAGGASLRRHWNAGKALELIRRGSWDYVVLQEQSTLPIKNRARFAESVRLFDDEIRRCGARTVLYLTWAREAAPQTQAILDEAIASIARELGAIVVPVGPAWQAAMTGHPDQRLYDKDGSHPTLAGSWVAAREFCKTLLQERRNDGEL